MTYIISKTCVGLKDGSCVDVCPVDCIYTTDNDDQYYINPENVSIAQRANLFVR